MLVNVIVRSDSALVYCLDSIFFAGDSGCCLFHRSPHLCLFFRGICRRCAEVIDCCPLCRATITDRAVDCQQADVTSLKDTQVDDILEHATTS